MNRGLRVLGFRIFMPQRGGAILDVGCGTGIHLEMYQRYGCKLYGIDTSQSMLELAKARLGENAELRLADANPFEVPENICALKDVPVLAFHGGKDTMVPASVKQELVDALAACGGDAKLTINPNYGHDIEMPTYAEPGFYDWLLAQSK